MSHPFDYVLIYMFYFSSPIELNIRKIGLLKSPTFHGLILIYHIQLNISYYYFRLSIVYIFTAFKKTYFLHTYFLKYNILSIFLSSFLLVSNMILESKWVCLYLEEDFFYEIIESLNYVFDLAFCYLIYAMFWRCRCFAVSIMS